MKRSALYGLAATLATAACLYSAPPAAQPAENQTSPWTQERRDTLRYHIREQWKHPEKYAHSIDMMQIFSDGVNMETGKLVGSRDVIRSWTSGEPPRYIATMSSVNAPDASPDGFNLNVTVNLRRPGGAVRPTMISVQDRHYSGICDYVEIEEEDAAAYDNEMLYSVHVPEQNTMSYKRAQELCTLAWNKLEELFAPKK